jgi:tetratricopeptide (TPR) repeat protein
MGKDQRLVVEKQIRKAEQLYKAKQFKKAGKSYHLAGNLLLKLNEYEKAKVCFMDSAKIFMEMRRFDTTVELFRQSGEACLRANNFRDANPIYKQALNLVPKLKSEGDRNSNYVIFSVLSYMCSYIKGTPNEGLEFLKKISKKVDKEFFKEHQLIKLVSEFTLALRDNESKYIKKIKDNIGNYKLRETELKLLKLVLLMTHFKLSITTSFKLDKEIYTTNEMLNLVLKIDTKPLVEIINNPFYQFELNQFNITKFLINLSDNLAAHNKPSVPLSLDIGKESQLKFKIKPHFQVDNSYIGPIVLTCELNNDLIFLYETQSIIPNLVSPPATLTASIKNLRPPLLDKTSPLEITIENQSEGEALDLKLDVEFPEQLKVMRGTTNKQIYSLKSNEDIKWEINLKPLEAGDYVIKIFIKFMDPDQNKIEEIKEFPFSIKL